MTKPTLEKRYKTYRQFSKAYQRFSHENRVVYWYASDHDWVLVLSKTLGNHYGHREGFLE